MTIPAGATSLSADFLFIEVDLTLKLVGQHILKTEEKQFKHN